MSGLPVANDAAREHLVAAHEGRLGDVPEGRRRQAQAICDYWPWLLLQDWGTLAPGSWHALFEPTTFKRVDSARVHAFVEGYVQAHGRWPKVANLRRLDGRPGNHRLSGESADQERLPV